jgi:hypothetical protein
MYYQIKSEDVFVSIISLNVNPLRLRDTKRSKIACYYDKQELKKAVEFCKKNNIKHKVIKYGTV